MSDKQIEENWKAHLVEFTKRLNQLKWIFVPLLFGTIILEFLGYIPFWSILVLMFLSLIPVIWLAKKYILCPQCGTSPLTKSGFKAGNICVKCGFKFDDEKQQSQEEKILAINENDRKSIGLNWEPLSTWSSNGDQGKLQKVSKTKIVFARDKWLIAFSLIFIGLGSLSLIPHLYEVYIYNKSIDWSLALLTSLFIVVGFGLLFFSPAPSSFDLTRDEFRKGSKRILLPYIQGLQLLSHEVSDSDGDYTNYQLNLILQGEARQSVNVYASKDNARKDAEQLADFLGVTLWKNIR